MYRALLGAMAILGLAPLALGARTDGQLDASGAVAPSQREAAEPVDGTTVSKHGSVTIRGQSIAYTVTAGSLLIRNDAHVPIASVFYVAYTADGAKTGADKPVAFFCNGGPGSASVQLHLGGLGPLRINASDVIDSAAGAYPLVPSESSLLDKTDLVFIDAIGTGLSHAVGTTKDQSFWGIDEDIDAFARAVEGWVHLNGRWTSPKFVIGESYAGGRVAGVARVLQERAMPLFGVVILSGAIDLPPRNSGYDQYFATFLPSLVAVSWYHHKLPHTSTDLPALVKEAREYAMGPYLVALAKGSDLTAEERAAVALRISSYTGLAESYILESNLRVDFLRYCKELLRDQGKTLGVLDGRYIGTDADAAGEMPEYDANNQAITGPFAIAINDYLFNVLRYKSERRYLTQNESQVQAGWNWLRKAPPTYYPWAFRPMTQDLAAALRLDRHLQVMAMFGYYDLAAPFTETEYELKHLQIDPSLARNVTFKYYEAGHLLYLDAATRPRMKEDLDAFFDASVHRKE